MIADRTMIVGSERMRQALMKTEPEAEASTGWRSRKHDG
jgi:hypothetical protein